MRFVRLAACAFVLIIASDGRADQPYAKRGHYIQLCEDPMDYSWMRSDGRYDPNYRWTDHVWVCGKLLAPGTKGSFQAWVDDSVEFDGTR